MNTNLSLNKSSCQMLVLLQGIQLCLSLFHFWTNESGPASIFVAQSLSRNTYLAILTTPICWPLGFGKTPCSPALSCAQLQGQCYPPSAGQAIPTPHSFKARLHKFPAASCWLLLLPGCLTGCASSTHDSSTIRPPPSSPPCVLLQRGWTLAHSLPLEHLWLAHFWLLTSLQGLPSPPSLTRHP